MNMVEMVMGQEVITKRRNLIDAYMVMVNSFVKQKDFPFDHLTQNSRVMLSDADDRAFSVAFNADGRVVLMRKTSSRWGQEITSANSMNIAEVNDAYEKLGDAVDKLFDQLGQLPAFQYFAQPFITAANMKPVIEIQRRISDNNRFHVSVKGHPGIWAAGDSIAEAVGDVIQSHAGTFGITFDYSAVPQPE